jgi:hypothetical protein
MMRGVKSAGRPTPLTAVAAALAPGAKTEAGRRQLGVPDQLGRTWHDSPTAGHRTQLFAHAATRARAQDAWRCSAVAA